MSSPFLKFFSKNFSYRQSKMRITFYHFFKNPSVIKHSSVIFDK